MGVFWLGFFDADVTGGFFHSFFCAGCSFFGEVFSGFVGRSRKRDS